MKRSIRSLFAAAVLTVLVSGVGAAQVRGGFTGNTFEGNDDGSTGWLSPGFTLNFFGVQYTGFWLNNNGNITFNAPMYTYTPFPIVTTGVPMIAPFFADVDTRAGARVTYGNGTVGGRNAWGAEWPGVCFYYVDCQQTNTFELVLIDRSDIAVGDFDFEFNYGHIGWETGDASGGVNGFGGSSARAGWSNGVSTSFEIPGSAVNGAFLDTNPMTGLVHTSNVGTNGRWAWQVRSGQVEEVVPEPITMILLGTGLAGIGAARRRRNKTEA